MSHTASGSSGWQLEGDAPLAYDTYIVDAFMQDYSRRLVDAASIKAGDRVLDVACGTGVVTRLAANTTGSEGQIVGFDLNPGMLARARASGETATNRRALLPNRPRYGVAQYCALGVTGDE